MWSATSAPRRPRRRWSGATGNGALILAAAGLLTGRRAATHWAYAEDLERQGATWASEPWLEDGRFLTAAGGAAGIDMMLALLARLKSRPAAEPCPTVHGVRP